MTAPSAKFIDIRFPFSSQNASQTASNPSFWAFSGETLTYFYDESSTQPYSVELPYTAHCRFIHDIDSRGPGIVDQGDMCILPNGDCLEFGHMVNPLSGQDEPYKEYWRSAEPIPHPDGIDDSKSCIVAQVASPTKVEGIVIRVGGRMQGILSRTHGDGTESVEVERWIRDTAVSNEQRSNLSTSSSSSTWTRDVRSTGSFIPSSWLTEPGRSLGENFEFNGVLWNITELQQ